MIPEAARHGLDALDRDERELRVRGREPLVSQERVGNAPAVVELANQVLGGHDHIVEEYLAELFIADYGLDWSDPDAWAVQIDQQKADAGLPRLSIGIGAQERVHPIRMMRPCRPDLMSAHREMIACKGRARGKAGKIGAGAGLGITLRPDHSPRDDGRQMLRLLRRRSELHQNGADVIEALRRHLRRADAPQLLRHDDLLVEGGAHSAKLLRPMRRDPAFA